MDNENSEFHYVKLPDSNGVGPDSITILIRRQLGRVSPISADDALEIHSEMAQFDGSITPLLPHR